MLNNQNSKNLWLNLCSAKTPFVLLETRKQDAQNFRTFFFDRPAGVIFCHYGDNIEDFFSNIDRGLKEGLWVAGYFSYELGYLLEDKLTNLILSKNPRIPLSWVGFFKRPTIIDHRKSSRCLFSATDESISEANLHCKIDELTLNTTRDEYVNAISRIKSYIESGETYQVNFTVKYRFSFKGSPALLYVALRDQQKVSYSAFLNDGQRTVISLSPELFLRKDSLYLQVKPMKGTVRRGRTPEEDQHLAQWLANDPKNQAENVMIVDLIRNDLGRLAPPGKVWVPHLFEVERYATLFQMTSTIASLLASETSWIRIFKALFPCGSVTGAPKIRTMEIIAELEKEPRGIYTGAIGYISPQGQACFNVPIRTIVMDQNHCAEMGIGSGIMYDSDATSEHEECLLKAQFLTQNKPIFSLIETMFLEDGTFFLLELHIKRLKDSAAYFDFCCPIYEIKDALLNLARQKSKGRFNIRLLLQKNGDFEFNEETLNEKRTFPVLMKISEKRVNSFDPFLYHKTTHRPLYQQERRKAMDEGFYEVIFLNEREEITEGTISNIFLEFSGDLYTPSLFSGLLPGTLRQKLLEDVQCRERVLYLNDLRLADKIYLGNSVRGLVEAVLRE